MTVAPRDPDTPGVPLPPPLFYLAGLVAGVALELAFPIDRPAAAVTLAGAIAGIAGGLALDGAALRSFRRAHTSALPFRPSTALVRRGPYRFTRNPMYVGMALLYCGLAFALGLVWPLVLLPFVIAAVDRLVVAREEAYLVRTFGDPYREYLTRSRRWL